MSEVVVIGFIVCIFFLGWIIFNIVGALITYKESKGKCLFHKDKIVLDKYPEGIRVPMGGFDRYICKRCGHTRSEKWSV